MVTVRAERGDTLLKIAREMSVDADALVRANSELASPDEPLGGELIHVPFIVRAATAVARRVRATALTSARDRAGVDHAQLICRPKLIRPFLDSRASDSL